jgi:methylenetetrahydrofolate dehydrogenase (NADP+)/methenyltetrahydrofolate cyclohydrolase
LPLQPFIRPFTNQII